MKRALLALLVLLFCALHQDLWYWRASRPLFLGVLPPGLWYHLVYMLAAAGLMALLVRFTWPQHLESAVPDDTGAASRTEGDSPR